MKKNITYFGHIIKHCIPQHTYCIQQYCRILQYLQITAQLSSATLLSYLHTYYIQPQYIRNQCHLSNFYVVRIHTCTMYWQSDLKKNDTLVIGQAYLVQLSNLLLLQEIQKRSCNTEDKTITSVSFFFSIRLHICSQK